MSTRAPRHQSFAKPKRLQPDRARRYGRTWMRLAKMVKARQPMCADPFGVHASEGIAVPGTQVDHIVPRKAGGLNAFENLQNLCASCHARKTALHDGGFGRTKQQMHVQAHDDAGSHASGIKVSATDASSSPNISEPVDGLISWGCASEDRAATPRTISRVLA